MSINVIDKPISQTTFVKTFNMKKEFNARSFKHTFRLNLNENEIFKSNVKRSGRIKSDYMRDMALYPCTCKLPAPSEDSDDKRKSSFNFIMSKEQMDTQSKGIGGILMLAFVLYQIYTK